MHRVSCAHRIRIHAKFLVKGGWSMSTDSVQSAPVPVWPLMVFIQNTITSPKNVRELNFTCARVCEKTRPCQSFPRFASQVGNCKFVLVFLIIHERRNLLRWWWTWIPTPWFDDKRRFCTPHVAFSGIPFISTIVGTRHCCKRLWHQALLQAPTLGEQASVSPNRRPRSSAPNRIGYLNTKLLISPRPPDSYNSTERNATEPHQQLTNISSKAPNATRNLVRQPLTHTLD